MQEKTDLQQVIAGFARRPSPVVCSGLSGAERAYLIAALARGGATPLVVVAPSAEEAARLEEDIRFFTGFGEDRVAAFPAYHLLPFKFISYHSQTAARRIRVLYRLVDLHPPDVVVTTVGALMQRLLPKQVLTGYAELIMSGEETDRERLVERLVCGGYSPTSLVEEPGDFSVRGGILDVFSPLYSDPLRIEFFGDKVDSIRLFSAVSQRKKAEIGEAVILPARESVIDEGNMAEIIQNIRRQAALLGLPVTKVREIVEDVRQRGEFAGIESFIPLVYPQPDTLFDYLPEGALPVLVEPAALEQAARDLREQAAGSYRQAVEESRLCLDPDRIYLSWTEIRERAAAFRPLTVKALDVAPPADGQAPQRLQYCFAVEDNSALAVRLKQARSGERLLSPVAEWIADKQSRGMRVVIVCRSRPQAERLDGLLTPYGVDLRPAADFPEAAAGDERRPGVCRGRLSAGFVWPQEELAILTEDEIFARRSRRSRPAPTRERAPLIDFSDLQQGDLVVHDDHGIGRYEGLVKLAVDGATNDFLLIHFRDNDKLYLPVVRMNVIQKYMGVEGVVPTLDKMGGKSWQKVRARVKKSVARIAGQLLKLYAARRVLQGHAFDPPDRLFREFEAGFAFQETPDQLRAIQDVIEDMTKPTPMDRLICGDVGYGKTEVALRAAFLAVSGGRQVAVLVPTTVLAEQHYATFSRRFEPYAVRVAGLSRFRTAREQRRILEGLADGTIDIVIGTHRLLSRDVKFADLGLLVLDEEQRFGVRHKERIKRMRRTVDVLTMTATPIPRTLHMSLTGVRDISVISTPPEARRPIVTYISEFDDAVVTEAVRRELARGGQVYFVHNNIHSIDAMAAHVAELVPEVRLDVAHGRMREKDLEEVMLRFMHREIDVLVCTTIIESGLDIPGANTIIVNRADRFGLSQMYQLRGRVGRSDQQAYAYLFIPRESALGRDAVKRLKVLMEHSDLGSGFQIAMNDLKIRGGGTILGASQSGHIAAVGYDTFLKLMEEAMADLKGEVRVKPLEPEVNVSLSAFLPDDYIPDIDQRLGAYRRLARMRALKEIAAFKQELEDRFGPLPEPAENLLLKIMLKVLCRRAAVKRLDLTGGTLTLTFSSDHLSDPDPVLRFAASEPARCSLGESHLLKVRLNAGSDRRLLSQTKNILNKIACRDNGL